MAGVAVGDRAVRFLGAGRHARAHRGAGQFEPMVDAVLARAEDDPAFAEVVDAAVRTALLAKARAGLLGLAQAPTSSRRRSALRTAWPCPSLLK